MTAKYTHDHAAFGELVMRSGFMVAAMRARMEPVMETAIATAPVDTGEYKSSFRLETKADGGTDGQRAEARVVNDSPDAVFVEFGNGNEGTAHHTLLRALDAAGD